jgi:hypothetical protein
MTRTTPTLFLCAAVGALAAGCGGAASHAAEPTLASQAQPLALGTPATGAAASACDRTVWSFRPEVAGRYRFHAQSEVPMSLRLFSMSPDLYLDTGRTDAEGAVVDSDLETDTTYAVTMASTDCRATHYALSVELAER